MRLTRLYCYAQYIMELRLDLHTKIGEVKRKLHAHNGTSMEHMELHLKNGGATVAVMLDDERPLGYYGVTNGMEIHVVDRDPFSLSRDGGLDDVSRIEKYRMSEDDYDKRENTLRAYKRKMLAQDPNFKFVPGNRRPAPVDPAVYNDAACVADMAVGNRCSVAPGDRRGEVAYLGLVEGLAEGYWVGVRLDEPLGKGDGSKNGKRYFDAPAGYGSFVRPDLVTVGDFPPEMELDGELGDGASAAAAHTHAAGCGCGGAGTPEAAGAAAGARDGCCSGAGSGGCCGADSSCGASGCGASACAAAGAGACACGEGCACSANGGSCACGSASAAAASGNVASGGAGGAAPVAPAAPAAAPAAAKPSGRGAPVRAGRRVMDDDDDDNDDEL